MERWNGAPVDAESTIELRRDPSEVAVARRFVRARLSSSARSVVEDAMLVVSELVTNAIEHGTGGPIVLGVGHGARGVVLRVRSVGPSSGVDLPERWAPAPPQAGSGRGLGIVASIAAGVELERSDDALITSVRLDD